MKRNILRLMQRITLAILALVITSVACGPEPHFINMFLEQGTPPSFSFSGDAPAVDFEVLELPRTKPLHKIDPYSYEGETIWKISVAARIGASKWPRITYGTLPKGFVQTVPEHGAPPILAEGKLYVARIVKTKDSWNSVFFKMQDGKPVNISNEVGVE